MIEASSQWIMLRMPAAPDVRNNLTKPTACVEVRFSHEGLGAGKAPVDHCGKDLGSQPAGIITDVDVDHKVGDPELLDQGNVAIQKSSHIFISLPGDKVRDRGDATRQCRRRAAGIVLHNASWRQVRRYFRAQMTVRIDTAGKDKHASRVDFPSPRRWSQITTDFGDGAVTYAHIGLRTRVRRHNETVANDEFRR